MREINHILQNKIKCIENMLTALRCRNHVVKSILLEKRRNHVFHFVLLKYEIHDRSRLRQLLFLFAKGIKKKKNFLNKNHYHLYSSSQS